MERIAAAVDAYEFEKIAQDIDSAGSYEADLLLSFRARLEAVKLNLSARLMRYGERIMSSGEPSYEEIHKVFSLANSLAILEKMQVDEASECLGSLAASIRRRALQDERYHMVREDVFGEHAPQWCREE